MIEALLGSDYFILLMFPGVLLSIFFGFPVAFSLMGMSLIFGYIGFGDAIGDMLIRRVWDVSTNYILAAVPLFVFMGSMLEASGIASRLFKAMIQWTGKLRGGLALGTVVMCTIFAAATGIIGAAEVVVGLLAIPAMLKYKYNKGLICGTICAGGSLGTIIPPSVVIVVFGPAAGLSVGKLLMAAIFPGILLSCLYIIYIIIRCWIRPEDGPGLPESDLDQPLSEKIKFTITALLPPLFLIFAVMGSILLGLAAPTEAAALGAFGAVILTIGYGKMNMKTFKDASINTLRISAMITLVLTGGTMYTGVFLGMGGGEIVEQILYTMSLPPWGMLALFLTITFVAGFLLDWISVLLIFVPIFVPIVTKMGFDPYWFSILFLMVIQTSYLTPPMAPAIFYLKGIVPPEIQLKDMFRGVVPYIFLQGIAIAIIILFPKIALWLPNIMIGFK
ncbi:MAG: TRAP transporter large permease subunit [Desulfobacula sp.]|uniref:TRAP transporter large permease n=1 Tax=Desulfobacula sp. TaxID=2593537 RepID=UPI0025C39D3D|nr:TRAP transporter large permease subunit [Desulfobacula sp.]MCD4722188.1 TRAP transporter large permease subunit [Desulfobacula sp.]